tara:strand:- start:24096 stop:24341 length:246 start_codon:yes stop_codon:yes gene_type:complete
MDKMVGECCDMELVALGVKVLEAVPGECPCCGDTGTVEVIQGEKRFLLCDGCHQEQVEAEIDSRELELELELEFADALVDD